MHLQQNINVIFVLALTETAVLSSTLFSFVSCTATKYVFIYYRVPTPDFFFPPI